MNKQNTLISGAIALAVGIIMVIHGNIRSSTLAAGIMMLGNQMPPGGGEMILGVFVALAGVITLIVGAVKKNNN